MCGSIEEKGQKVKEFQFQNRVWVDGRSSFFDKVCMFFAGLYLILSVFQLLIKELGSPNIPMIFFSAAILIWSKKNCRRNGKYLSVDCRLCFSERMLDWFYDQIDLLDGQGARSIQYHFNAGSVTRVQLSSQMKSIRIEAAPDITVQYRRKSKRTVSKDKSCVLVLYCEEIEKIGKSLVNSFGCTIEFCD